MPDPELIDVRPDERIDTDRLAAWLRGRLPGTDRPLTIRQFGRGKANLTYLLRFGDGDDTVEYVLRRPPLGPVAPGSHDMAREYRAMSWEPGATGPRGGRRRTYSTVSSPSPNRSR